MNYATEYLVTLEIICYPHDVNCNLVLEDNIVNVKGNTESGSSRRPCLA